MRSLFSKSQTPPRSKNSPKEETMTIARLICKRQWQQLEQILICADDDTGVQIPIDDPSIPHAITQDTIIHFAARFQAPLRIIVLLSNIYASSLEQSDANGRFPIHVAAKWGATPDAIRYLISSNPAVAGVQDDLGKTPMHYVGDFYQTSYCYQNYRNVNPNCSQSMLQVVQLLKTAAPKSVNLEDHEGINAIEYALDANADLKVIRTMQRASRDDWRDMKKVGQVEGKKHADFTKDLERMASNLQRELLLSRRRNNPDAKATTRVARTA